MKNLMVTAALVIGLLSTSVSFADEVIPTDARLSAFENVQSVSASDEELKVAGEGAVQQLKPYVKDSFRAFGAVGCQLYNANGGNCNYVPNYKTSVFKAVDRFGTWVGNKI